MGRRCQGARAAQVRVSVQLDRGAFAAPARWPRCAHATPRYAWPRQLWSVLGTNQRSRLLNADAEHARALAQEALRGRELMRARGVRPSPLARADARAQDPVTSTGVGRRVRAMRWEDWEATARHSSNALSFYSSHSLRDTRGFHVWAVAYPEYAAGFHWLARLRVGGLLRVRPLKRALWRLRTRARAPAAPA